MHLTIDETHVCLGLSADLEIDWAHRRRIDDEDEAVALLRPCEQEPELMHKLREVLQELDPGTPDQLDPALVVRALAHRVAYGGLWMWVEAPPFDDQDSSPLPREDEYTPLGDG